MLGILTGLFVLTASGFSATSSYTTSFPLNENPISEGGKWAHLDPTLTKVMTETIGGVHVAHGTMTGSGFYDDSSAYLSGFSVDHSLEGTIWKSASIPNDGLNREVEVLLRWSDNNPQRSTSYGPTSAEGYEINMNQYGAYLNIGRFKGALLATTTLGTTPQTGDKLRAQIVTNANGSATVSVYYNNVLRLTATDGTPYTKGNPGIGFYIRSGAPNNQFGFSSITATSLGSAVPTAPAPPTNLRIK